MAQRSEQVANYIARVAAKHDIASLLAPDVGPGLESAEVPGFLDEVRAHASAGLREILRGSVPTQEQTAGIEAIILPKIRPVLDIVGGDFRTDHPLWLKLNEDEAIRAKLKAAIPSIGRIELPGHPDYPYGGSGFVVGDGLVMTNRHVAAIFTHGIGTRRLTFKPGHRAGIDFLRELDRPTGPTMFVRQVVMVHPYWDMALLAVDGLNAQIKPLRLSLTDPSAEQMIEVAAIGYPAFDIRNDRDVQNDLFRRVFGVKRLQPGTLGGRRNTESFGKLVAAVRHNCSTLGGNSGSALIDLSTGDVVALHFGGRYQDINYGVPSSELAKDPRVVDAGVTFITDSLPRVEPAWSDWWRRADESVPREPAQAVSARREPQIAPAALPIVNREDMPDGSLRMVVPLHVTFSFGRIGQEIGLTTVAEADLGRGGEVERLVTPWHDDDYSSRVGYDKFFLDPEERRLDVPMPIPVDTSIVAKTLDGDAILHYQNFSIMMHAQRRIALFTASNVTAAAALKQPEAGRPYTRKGLSGLGKSDQERWFPDPRLGEEYQLPDVFYTRDDGAFDKGHIVRREDVAWGKTYAVVRRANGDTYHVTNCSPQVAPFNRGTLGEDNWGDLEDHVLRGASTERYCLFAGPILDASDEVFVGSAGRGVRLRVKIPSRYWKVIVVRTEQGLTSYGFVLEQDLSAVPFEEFVVPERFVRFMEPLVELQERAGIQFADIVLAADQHGTNEGMEVAFHAGVKRRSRAEGVIAEGVIL
jgi:endonuclease G